MKYSLKPVMKEIDTVSWRKKHNLSCRKFAELCGVEYTHIFRLEKGTYIATHHTAEKIIRAMEAYRP